MFGLFRSFGIFCGRQTLEVLLHFVVETFFSFESSTSCELLCVVFFALFFPFCLQFFYFFSENIKDVANLSAFLRIIFWSYFVTPLPDCSGMSTIDKLEIRPT